MRHDSLRSVRIVLCLFADRLMRDLRVLAAAVSLLKAGDTRFIFKYAVRVRQQASENPGLAGFFDAGDILIPVPRSVPRSRAGVWSPSTWRRPW